MIDHLSQRHKERKCVASGILCLQKKTDWILDHEQAGGSKYKIHPQTNNYWQSLLVHIYMRTMEWMLGKRKAMCTLSERKHHEKQQRMHTGSHTGNSLLAQQS
jgi:hypothetical protein